MLNHKFSPQTSRFVSIWFINFKKYLIGPQTFHVMSDVSLNFRNVTKSLTYSKFLKLTSLLGLKLNFMFNRTLNFQFCV